MKICVAIPNGGSVKSRTMVDVMAAVFSQVHQYSFVIAESESSLGPYSRWQAGQQAIRCGCDYLWLIDADQALPADALPRLLAHHKEVVAAPYHYRRLPLMTTVKMLNENGQIIIPDTLPRELFAAHAVGSGCKLVQVKALTRIPQPWFACAWDEQTGQMTKTDDVWFCEQAAKVGIQTWVDPTIDVKHIGDFLY